MDEDDNIGSRAAMSLDLKRPGSQGDAGSDSRSSISDFRRQPPAEVVPDGPMGELQVVHQRLLFGANTMQLERLDTIINELMAEECGAFPYVDNKLIESLTDQLLVYSSDKTRSIVHPELTRSAKLSLQLLFKLLQNCTFSACSGCTMLRVLSLE